jgi:hypothetical protein
MIWAIRWAVSAMVNGRTPALRPCSGRSGPPNAIRHAWSSLTKAMGIDVDREQRLEHGLQRIGDPKSCCGVVMWRSPPVSLLCCFFVDGKLREG